MDADEFHKLLGKATSNAQTFEMAVHLVLGGCLGLNNELALRLGHHLTIRTALEVIAELAATPKCQLDPTRVQHWLPTATEANIARNRVIHSPWVGDPATGKMIGVIDVKKKGPSVWTVPRSAVELQADIDRMRTAAEDGHALLGLQAHLTAKKGP
jgi:hypothetical protein